MSRVFWDTNIFIYLFEGQGRLSQEVAALRTRMQLRGDQLLTSTITLGEILVKPIENGDARLAARYEKFLERNSILLPFDNRAAMAYARLRADRSLRPPDTIQLACAASTGVDLFITNDVRLHSKQIPGIQFIVPLDNVPI